MLEVTNTIKTSDLFFTGLQFTYPAKYIWQRPVYVFGVGSTAVIVSTASMVSFILKGTLLVDKLTALVCTKFGVRWRDSH
jgi:hypothetical protein